MAQADALGAHTGFLYQHVHELSNLIEDVLVPQAGLRRDALVDELTDALGATAAAVVLSTHDRQLLRDVDD